MSRLEETVEALQNTTLNSSMTSEDNGSSSTLVSVVDPLFKDPDADITFCSAEGTHFQLQRKFLEANTGAFPGSEFDTRGEVVHLTESDVILRVLFGFVHPRRHPDVEELPFTLLAGVAEAAEKYEVFSAVNVCKMQMRQFVSTHPLEILAHATKHDHPMLIKEVAPHLARAPLVEVVRQLPSRYVLPWLEYHTAFANIFEDAVKTVMDALICNRNRQPFYFASSLQPAVCYACKTAMLTVIQELKETSSVSELKESVGKPRPRQMGCLSPGCSYPSMLSKLCEDMKTKIEALSVFKLES